MRRSLLRTRRRQYKSPLEMPMPYPTHRHVRHPVFTLGVHRFRRGSIVPTCCLSAGRNAVGAGVCGSGAEASSTGRLSTMTFGVFKIQSQSETNRRIVTHLNLHPSWTLLPFQSRPCKHQGSGILIVGGVAALGRQPLACTGYPSKVHGQDQRRIQPKFMTLGLNY